MVTFRRIKRRLRNQRIGLSVINAYSEFPIYWPASAGTYNDMAKITFESIAQSIPLMSNFTGKKITSLEQFISDLPAVDASKLGNILNKFGSDKAHKHNYYILYSHILGETTKTGKIFEIGLGTNNTHISSNMGKHGVPGASLRAFQEYMPNSSIYGADVDKNILFREKRIRTYFIDQLNQATFEEVGQDIGENFDLMIDVMMNSHFLGFLFSFMHFAAT